MKKISLKNFKNTLNRDEMRGIRGGDPNISYDFGDGAGKCDSDCSPTGANTCATVDCPNSYCSTQTCNVSGDLHIRRYSCQYQ